MTKSRLLSILLALLILGVVPSAYASGNMGRISGEVLGRDELGNFVPLNNAVVEASAYRTYSTTSGKDGTFILEVPAGGYVVTASAKGYLPSSHQVLTEEGVELKISFLLDRQRDVGRAVALNVTPKSATVKVGEEAMYSVDVSVIGYEGGEVALSAFTETREIGLEVTPSKIQVSPYSIGNAILKATASQQVKAGFYVLTVQVRASIEGIELLRTERVQLQVEVPETPATPTVPLSELDSAPYIYGLVGVVLVAVLAAAWKKRTRSFEACLEITKIRAAI